MKGTFNVTLSWRNKFGEVTDYSETVEFNPKKIGDNLTPVVTKAIEQSGLTKTPLNENSAVQITVTRAAQLRDFTVSGGEAAAGGAKVKASSVADALSQVPGATHAEIAG